MCDLFIFRGWEGSCFASLWAELERGGVRSRDFKFVQFLQDCQSGQLSRSLQAEPSPLAQVLQALSQGSCWTEEVMRAVASIFHRNPWFFKEHFHVSRQVRNSSVGFWSTETPFDICQGQDRNHLPSCPNLKLPPGGQSLSGGGGVQRGASPSSSLLSVFHAPALAQCCRNKPTALCESFQGASKR